MISRVWKVCIALTRPQIRSLFAVAMLLGIVALSAQGWVYVGLLHHEAHTGTTELFGIVAEALRWTFGLIAVLVVCVALVVFGADYLRFKYGDAEVSAGKGE